MLGTANQPLRLARTLMLSSIVGLAGTSGAMGQASGESARSGGPEASLRGPTNAALRHYRAWGSTSAEALTAFSEAWAASNEVTPGWKPTAALKKAVDELNDYVALTLRAAELPAADWGVEYADGWKALLPHLGKVREASRVIEAYGRTRLVEGGPEGHADAARSLGAMFRLAGHVRQDRTLISTLVAGAITARGAAVVGALLDEGLLTPADAAAIAGRMETLPGVDPFNFAGAMRVEQVLSMSVFQAEGPEAGRKAASAAREILSMQGEGAASEQAALLARLEGMDEAALRTDLGLHTNYFAQVESAVRSGGPEAAEKLADLEKRAGRGDFGVTVRLTGPSLTKAYASDTRNRAALEAVRSRLAAHAARK